MNMQGHIIAVEALCCWAITATSYETCFKPSKWLPADYIKFYRGKLPENQQDTKSDQDVLREHYRQELASPMLCPHAHHCL